MIQLKNVNKYFNKRKENEIHVINNTSIELGSKGLVTFLGNSGCGKSTLLNAIGGLDKVDSGEIFIDNQSLTKIRDGKKDEIRNANIGYIFQNYNLIEDKSVFYNVEIVLRMMGIKDKSEIEKRVLFILERVGIERYKNRPVKALSGGERQRVGIARALVKSPKIIIADEPTGNLDSKNTLEIMNIIKAISKEKLVILVTHEKDIAEFYADRIVKIVDGKIVSDNENTNKKELDYHLENKIFLKDMPVQKQLILAKEENNELESSQNKVNINYFSDNQDKTINLKVIVKNNNIYIDIPEGYRRGSENIQLVDGHYEKIGHDIYEDYKFDYDDIKANGKIKYTSIFNWGEIIISGYKKVFSYSAIKKILLLGFVFAAILTMYSVSAISASRDIKDVDFLKSHKNYISIETGQLSMDVFEKYNNMEGVDYAIPGNAKMVLQIPIDDYYQTIGQKIEGTATIADWAMVKKKNLIAGKMPSKSTQVILDKIVAQRIIDEGVINHIGIKEPVDFVGRKVNGGNAGMLEIVGICDSGSPAIYMDPNNFLKVMVGIENADEGANEGAKIWNADVNDYHSELEKGNITLKAGNLPRKGEVMLSYDKYGLYYVGSVSDIKLNGKKLKVSGFYEDRIPGRDFSFVSTDELEKAIISSNKNLIISPSDKEATYNELKSVAKIHDIYNEERDEYVSGLKERMFSTVLASIVILIISLVEIYLILRASFLSRIKEVGVLRAIGLKKKDIYKMFFGEIFAMTTLTSVPAFIFMGYILNKIQNLPYIGEFVKMDFGVAIISICIIVVANLIFGLLPVFSTMRKTPADILARNDVN